MKSMHSDTDFKLKLESLIPHGYYTFQNDRSNPEIYIRSWFKKALKTKPNHIDMQECRSCNKCNILNPTCVLK